MMTTEQPRPAPTKDADKIAQLINHENEMVNHRMHWFLILQGFMFAGIAFAWDKNDALCIVFSSVGILSALSVGTLLQCGLRAIRNLQEETTERAIGRSAGESGPFVRALLPWNFLPVVLSAAWIAMIVIKLQCPEGP